MRINLSNNKSSHQGRLLRKRAQQGNLEYHDQVLSNFENSENPNFKTTWYSADLKCQVRNVKCNEHSQLELKFSSHKHKISVWNLTPEYCAPSEFFGALVLLSCGSSRFT